MKKEAAFLWDESFLWGIMAQEALESAGLPYTLIRAADIKNGLLGNFEILFVPGGWASNKMKALGDEGAEQIRRFVHEGGSYLGFCGGAGLATRDGIGLIDVARRPTKDRVPSFSGRIRLNTVFHPIWQTDSDQIFHAWWPSQFIVGKGEVKVLASYGEALDDAFSSDLNVGDVRAFGSWKASEERYKINLDPARLMNEPAVVEGRYGNGKVVLSLVHFDTPDDLNGASVLRNIWDYLGVDTAAASKAADMISGKTSLPNISSYNAVAGMYAAASDLIKLGERSFLWFWRTPRLLQWRRGVRGLEYCTLYILLRRIAEQLSSIAGAKQQEELPEQLSAQISGLTGPFNLFVSSAKQLLFLERQAMQDSRVTYEHCDDAYIKEIRNLLFSTTKSHGGLFKELVSMLDELLYSLISTQ